MSTTTVAEKEILKTAPERLPEKMMAAVFAGNKKISLQEVFFPNPALSRFW